MKKLILLITVFFGLKHLHAQPGKLDSSFGNNGIVKSIFGALKNENSSGRQVLLQANGSSIFIIIEVKEQTLIAKRLSNGSPDLSYGVNGFSVSVPIRGAHAVMQPDGKIVVAGSINNGNEYASNYTDYSIARFNTNGSLDKTFDNDGQVTTDFGYNEGGSAIALQPDGKILIAGNYNSEFDPVRFDIIRYNNNGSLDKAFHADQLLRSRFGDFEGNATSIAVQPDGKIVTSGTFYTEADSPPFLLMRFNTNGSLDPAFGDNGIATDKDAVNANSIIFSSNGKIVGAGGTLLRRYNTNGTPDNSFSGDGKQTVDFPVASASIQSDGKLVVGGTLNNNFALARYNTDGSLDNTFTGDGRQITDFGTAVNLKSVAIQNNGKIVAAGSAFNGGITNFAVARYSVNGTLDNTLSSDGTLTGHLRRGNTVYRSTVVQSDGKIIAGGDRVLVRYLSTGILDKTFSGDGIKTTRFSIHSLALQTDGKIVAAGDSVLARYNTDGSIDSSFARDGKQNVHFIINSIVIQSNGKIVAGGSRLARFKTDGSPDISFAGDGEIITPFTCNDLAIQSDGKVVAVGTLERNFAIARYTIGGYPDNSFNGDGLQTTDFNPQDGDYPGYNEEFHAQSVAIQSDGKIVAAGYSEYPYRDYRASFALARYTADGSLDNSFSDDGMQITGFGRTDRASSVAIQNDGKILVAGYARNESNKNFALARYNIDGNLDSSFGSGGLQTTQVSGADDEIESIAISNNKLYAVGYAQDADSAGVVARYFLNDESKAPAVTLTISNNIVKYSSPAEFKLKAAVTNEDAAIEKVEFYNDTTLLHMETKAPYGYSLTNMPLGNYTFTAKAYDNKGRIIRSNTINVSVVHYNVEPVVSIVSPGGDTTYASPATIHLIANAKDPNDKITKVAFYNRNVLLTTEYHYPYTYTWNDVQPGRYAITAKATDGKGLSATSSIVTVSVPGPPSVTITNPVNNATFAPGGTIEIRAAAQAPYGTISKVEFYAGTTLLFTDTESPYGYEWSNVPLGNYTLTAKATSNTGVVAVSDLVHVSVVASKPPVVNITSPANNTTFAAPANINVSAVATDPDANGTVSKVEFYVNNALLFIDTKSPFTYSWTDVPVGNYTFTAKATDNTGLVTTSQEVAVSVVPNKAPAVSIITPENYQVYAAPATVNITAKANDEDGTVSKVEFYYYNRSIEGYSLLSTDNTAPYTFTWKNIPENSYTVMVKATDDKGLSTVKYAVIRVQNVAIAEAISIVSPENHAVYNAPANILIKTEIKNVNQFIRKVEFYNGSTLLYTARTSPYTFNWQNAARGNYALTAKATDAADQIVVSDTVYITVKAFNTTIVSSKLASNSTDANGALSLKLSPNPASSVLQISTNGLQLNKPSTLSVISAAGVVMKTIQLNSLNKTLQLDVSSLVSGVYTLKIASGDKVMYKQFVKL